MDSPNSSSHRPWTPLTPRTSRRNAQETSSRTSGRPQNFPLSQMQLDQNNSDSWRSLPDFAVELDDLPTSVTTENLWDWFSDEGEIVYLDIHESHTIQGKMHALIRFEPPPGRKFWSTGTYYIPHPDELTYPNGLEVKVKQGRNMVSRQYIPSPVSPDRQYPIKFILWPRSVEIGSFTGPRSMKAMKSLSSIGEGRALKVEVNLRFKEIAIFFQVETIFGSTQFIREHKMMVNLSQIKTIYQTPSEEDACTLVLPLKLPPHYYWKKSDPKSTFSQETKSWNAKEAWIRATDINEEADLPMKYPVAVHTEIPDPSFIDIGRWTCFRLVFHNHDAEAQAKNHLFQSVLEDFNIRFQDVKSDFNVQPGEPAVIWSHLDHPQLTEETGALGLLDFSANSVFQLPFEVRYQLEVCISRGLLNEHTITTEFLQQLANMNPVKARLQLEFLADQDKSLFEPMSLFQNPEAEAYHPNPRIPHYCAMVRKAVITPTTIRYNTPTVETSNRVMRRYNHIQDRFLRIQFLDESEKARISFNKDQCDEIWKRILRTLFQGIRIGDRIYEFLAFGSSQLRQNGAYFFCPTHHVSCDDIRKWMGRFSHIKVIAKYSARLGQCFSTTREIRGIFVPAISSMPDEERNGYCFTDGVGIISPFLSKLVIEEMELDVFDKPSAFQFRMGGCKGVLAEWPEHAKGTQVYVRKSQEKFKADYNGLEIIRCAKFTTATLNRQTITILESLGVDSTIFLKLLDQQLRSYERAMIDNHTAVDLLTKFVDENQTTLVIAELLKSGFKTDTIQEPFVVNILSLWRSWSLKLLKDKARIFVEKSAFVLGCVDETGTLRGHSTATEGSLDKDVNKLPQIFLQTTDSKVYNKTHIIRGLCIIGRNPSLHPGDIRVVQAVDNPKLHHLKDVVVFPKTGDRPVPNMLSGGDLDGDDFFVIWDPELLPKKWNHPPMNYTGSQPQDLDRDVDVDDLRYFFVKYMKNDVLPLIACAHLADSDKHGPDSPRCIRLAELHSDAVDYPKTGEPVVWKRDYQPKKWPHFMEKKNSYRSCKALGKIYDKVVNRSIQFKPIWDSPFDERITKRFELGSDILEAARKIKTQYDISVRRLLSQHALKTEFELWAGFPMSKPAAGTSYKYSEDLGHEYDSLKHRFRQLCYDAAGGKSPEQIDPFVAAMYVITEEEIKIALHEHRTHEESMPLDARSAPFISFSWIFHWVLVRIALGNRYDSKTSILAAARRKTNLHSVVRPKADEKEAHTDSEKTWASGLGPEVLTHLPDGSVIHRGQPLVLFHPEEDAGPADASHWDDGEDAEAEPRNGMQSEEEGGDETEANPMDMLTDLTK